VTLFAELARASVEIAQTRSRNAKIDLIATLLAKLEADEVASAAGWLSAEPPCGPLGLGYANLYALQSEPFAEESLLSIGDVDALLDALGDVARPDLLSGAASLFRRLTKEERDFMVASMTYTLRQGGLAGLLLAAIAKASALEERDVRRAAMVLGSAARAADAALGRGKGTPLPSRLELFQPLAPMLASPRDTVPEGLEGLETARVEWKVDGVRAQIHKRGSRIAAYSRQGNEIAIGAVAEALSAIAAEDAVIDSEIAVVDEAEHAQPFQDTFSWISGGAAAGGGKYLRVFAFDCLHRDGRDLVDEPLSARVAALAEIAPASLRMPAIVTSSAEEAQRFFDDSRAHGHEGVVVKALDSPYALGARGDAWRKVKAIVTVDLVILAVEWGSGRRKGFLSNLHLGARREDGSFCMVGKTFKGLTDEMLAWQTKRLLELETSRDRHVVHVRPEQVVEIAFNDVQRSRRYPGGIALRFARVVRHREDKKAEEADTLETLQAHAPKSTGEGSGANKKKKSEAKPKKQLSLFDD
jgi:DNA ligase-1